MTYSYENLRAGAGLDLGRSRWIAIDQDRIDNFADVSEDHQWIHVDPDLAVDSVFGSTIAHGYLTIPWSAHFSANFSRSTTTS